MKLLQRLKKLVSGRDPVRAAKLLAKGVRLAREGDLEEALKLYRKSARADREYPLAHLNVALAMQDLYNREHTELSEDLRIERLDEINDVLQHALELDGALAAAYSARGYVMRALGRDEEAVADLELFLDLAPADEPRREEIETDLVSLQERVDLAERRQEVIGWIKDPQSQDDQLVEAVEFIDQMLAKDPEDAELLWAMGVALRRQGDLESARETFVYCLQQDPSNQAVLRELSSLAFCEQAYDEALEYAHRAYEQDPTNPAVVCNVGVCYLHMGRLRKAKEYIHLAHQLDPDDSIINACVGELTRVAKEAGLSGETEELALDQALDHQYETEPDSDAVAADSELGTEPGQDEEDD